MFKRTMARGLPVNRLSREASVSMTKQRGFHGWVLLTMTVAVAGTLVSPSSARSDTVGIIVPAYFYPGTGGTEGFTDGWAQMAAAAGKVPITAIMNPDSGPSPGPADP